MTTDRWWSLEGSSWAAYRQACNRNNRLLLSQKLTLASDIHETARLRAGRARLPDVRGRAEREMRAAQSLVERTWNELRGLPQTAQLAITSEVYAKTGRTIP